MNKKEVYDIILRYLILIIIAFPNLFLFYKIFTPLTIYPVYFLLSFFYKVLLISNDLLFFNGVYANIVPACVAGAAYYLLFILNLTTKMPLDKRVKSLFFVVLLFLGLNIIRITVFAALFSNGYEYFDLAHSLVWYLGSSFLVIIIWFVNILVFRIKEIPMYTDFRSIIKDMHYKIR